MKLRRMHVTILGLLSLGACGGTGTGGDAGLPDSTTVCESAADCDDGMYCNGAERCEPSADNADGRGCISGDVPCVGVCDEEEDRCVESCPDADSDGFADAACGGEDCDDSDSERFPGNTEVCDAAGHDEDCDSETLGPDGDGDGYVSDECCNDDVCGRDCDDADAAISPDALDGCGSGDEDCDGTFDEDPNELVYRDRDGDGFGTVDETLNACGAPMGYAPLNTDCNDELRQVNPGAAEVCDGGSDPTNSDEDCDGTIDEGCGCSPVGRERTCGSETARSGEGVCRPGTQTCENTVGGTDWGSCVDSVEPSDEVCNGTDEDCDGMVDETFACRQGETVVGTNACGREGSRRCSAGCSWETPDFATTESSATCDYCDDSGAGLSAEVPFATQDAEFVIRQDDSALPYTARFFGDAANLAGRLNITLESIGQLGGVYAIDPVRVGYGPIEITVPVEVVGGGEPGFSDPTGEGWAFVLIEDDDEVEFLGNDGAFLGVPRGEVGLSVEWDTNGTDELRLRHLSSSRFIGNPVIASSAAFPQAQGDETVVQTIRVRINPSSSAGDATVARVDFLDAFDRWQQGPRCGGAGETSCGFSVSAGTSYYFGVTATTGNRLGGKVSTTSLFSNTFEDLVTLSLENRCAE